MEKETYASTANKYNPNREVVLMRAQWKKADNCKKQWIERWSWLLDEQRDLLREINDIKQETLPLRETKEKPKKSLKPVPFTSTGMIGWLASRPEYSLEIYGAWMNKPAIRLPNAWDHKNYVGHTTQQ